MAGTLDSYGPKRTGNRGGRSNPYKVKPTQVFVGNLPWSTKWQDLKDMCKKYGEVKRADVEEEADGRSKGFGIVVFKTAGAAQKCIDELNGEIVGGRDLSVKLDTKPEKYKRSRQTQGSGMMMGMGRKGECQVFVGNLPWAIKWQDLKDMGKEFGTVKRADVAEENDGRSKGHGIIIFADAGSAHACVSGLDGMEVDGRALTVKIDEKPNQGITSDFSRGGGIQFGNHHLSAPGGNGNFSRGGGMQFGKHHLSAPGMGGGDVNFSRGGGMQFGKHHLSAPGMRGGDVNFSRGGGMQFGKHHLSAPGMGGGDVNFSRGGGMQFGKHHLSAPGMMGGGGGKQFGRHQLSAPGMMGSGGFNSMGSSTVYVGNLPWSVEWQELKDMCKSFGDVIRADVEENEEGKSKGYGIVKFANPMSAQRCIENLNGRFLDGRDLEVRIDKFGGGSTGRASARVSRWKKRSNGKTPSRRVKKEPSSLNWNDKVPDQESLDAEMEAYHSKRSKSTV